MNLALAALLCVPPVLPGLELGHGGAMPVDVVAGSLQVVDELFDLGICEVVERDVGAVAPYAPAPRLCDPNHLNAAIELGDVTGDVARALELDEDLTERLRANLKFDAHVALGHLAMRVKHGEDATLPAQDVGGGVPRDAPDGGVPLLQGPAGAPEFGDEVEP